MARYLVTYQGIIYVEANSEFEAECDAAFECKPDNCKAEELPQAVDPSHK